MATKVSWNTYVNIYIEEFSVRNIDSVVEASAKISEIPGVLDRVRQSLHRRLNTCIETDRF